MNTEILDYAVVSPNGRVFFWHNIMQEKLEEIVIPSMKSGDILCVWKKDKNWYPIHRVGKPLSQTEKKSRIKIRTKDIV